MTAEQLVIAVEVAGSVLELQGNKLKFQLSRAGGHLLPLLKESEPEIVALLRQRNSCPTPLSYAEYFCRLRAAGIVPRSREEWEVEHGSDAERMERYRQLCRWGAIGEHGKLPYDTQAIQ